MPDVNVWVALATARHVHSKASAAWFDSLDVGQAGFCRVTQMGMLRLLTNVRVMGGEALSVSQAWHVYDALADDARSRFFPEPAGIELAWRGLTRGPRPSTNVWTDAYLQAFAELGGVTLVTFDRGLAGTAPKPLILG